MWRYEKDPLDVIRIRISNSYKTVRSAKTSVLKNWTPPFAQVCGNMYNYVLKNSSHHPQKWIMI